jgi:hypothetical protein
MKPMAFLQCVDLDQNRFGILFNNLRGKRSLEAIVMDQLPVEELVGLHRFLERLESADTNVYRNNIDVTESEINILKREIAYLDRLLASIKSKDNISQAAIRLLAPGAK